jgi:RNA polymerase sigma-70 factor (ECF subfamily)
MSGKSSQDERYVRIAAKFGAALERLARAYEGDPDLRRDLIQDIHIALWQSLARFDGRCSERTWAYRVAHNIGASHVRRRQRIARTRFTTLDDLAVAATSAPGDPEIEASDRQALARLMSLIHALAPVDRQIVLLWPRSPVSHLARSPRNFTGSRLYWPTGSSREAAMPTETPGDPIKTLWQTQSKETETMQLEEIISKARAFQARVRRRNLLEYALAVFGIAVFAIYAWVYPGWMIKTGSVLCILAAVNFVLQRHYRAAARHVPEAPAAALVDFHRSELVRHREAVGRSWLWEDALMLPGAALILLGRWFQFHAPEVPVTLDHFVIILATIIVVLTLVIVALAGRIRVYRLQREIDELDRQRGS